MESNAPFINVPAFYVALPYLCLLIFVNWVGYRYKKRQIKKFPDLKPAGLGPTEASLLGLMALLLIFYLRDVGHKI